MVGWWWICGLAAVEDLLVVGGVLVVVGGGLVAVGGGLVAVGGGLVAVGGGLVAVGGGLMGFTLSPVSHVVVCLTFGVSVLTCLPSPSLRLLYTPIKPPITTSTPPTPPTSPYRRQ